MEQHLMPKVGELAHIMEGFVIGMILSMSPIENINEMTNQLFNVTPLKSRSLMQRVFKQLPKENAVIDLNNLLANQPIQNITVQQIQEIQIRYSVNLQREYELNLKEFYAVYFNYCLKDKHLSDAEIQDLNHLKKLFSLSDKTVQELQHKIGEEVYNEAYQGAIADGRLTEQEQAFLSKLENQLLLPRDLVEKIEIEAKKGFLNRYVADAIKDDRISPQEEEELQAIAESLNINIEMDASSKEEFNKLKGSIESEAYEDALSEIDNIFEKISEISGLEEVANKLDDLYSALDAEELNKEDINNFSNDTFNLVDQELEWRKTAAIDLLPKLKKYNEIIKNNIGLRLQSKLTKDQAKFVAACNADHKDISLNF